MPNTEMDGETHDGRKTHCPMDNCLGRVDVESCSKYCLGRDDVETCHKYSWSPELRERLVSLIIGDGLRVTRCRMVSRSSDQVEGRGSP